MTDIATTPPAAAPSPSAAPLAGIRVLDLTRLLPGPLASLRLAEMGAEVIKIEEPGIGDYARLIGPVRHSVSQFFVLLNHGKQFVRLDLKQAADRAQFLQMVESADVVLESFRPGVMDKLGLGWPDLKKCNPKLVLCSISSYGQTGPFATQAGHDLNFVGYAGVLQQQAASPDADPVVGNLQIGDVLGGAQTALQGVLAALVAAKMGGAGRWIDVSMTDAVLANNLMPLVSWNSFGSLPKPGADLLTGAVPCYRVYRTSDARHMAVGALELKFWQMCCEVLQRPDWKNRHWMCGLAPNSAESDQLRDDMIALFGQQPLSYWIERFATADCCVTPVLTLEEALQHPLFVARNMVTRAEHETEGAFWKTGGGLQFFS